MSEGKAINAKKSTLQQIFTAENRSIRLGFTKYLHERYNLSAQTAYGKLRRNLIKEWERIGLDECAHRFMPEFTGSANDFYQYYWGFKNRFEQFMAQFGMCSKTANIRFRAADFTELECKGLEAAFEEFMKQGEYETDKE